MDENADLSTIWCGCHLFYNTNLISFNAEKIMQRILQIIKYCATVWTKKEDQNDNKINQKLDKRQVLAGDLTPLTENLAFILRLWVGKQIMWVM